MKRIAVVISAVLLIAACGSAEEAERSTTVAGDVSTTDNSESPRTTTDDVTVPGQVVEAAVGQAIADTGSERGSLEVVTAHQVVWSDASLGCPEEGQSYAQVLTDGYWVVLSGPEGELDYRSTLELDFRRCVEGREPTEIVGGS